MITPTASFKENLQLLASVDGISHINIMDSVGTIVDTIENKPGKQGSLVVYRYLAENSGSIDAKAAAHGLEIFAEHTVDAKNRPGAHPNIDRLVDVIDTGKSLDVQVVRA